MARYIDLKTAETLTENEVESRVLDSGKCAEVPIRDIHDLMQQCLNDQEFLKETCGVLLADESLYFHQKVFGEPIIGLPYELYHKVRVEWLKNKLYYTTAYAFDEEKETNQALIIIDQLLDERAKLDQNQKIDQTPPESAEKAPNQPRVPDHVLTAINVLHHVLTAINVLLNQYGYHLLFETDVGTDDGSTWKLLWNDELKEVVATVIKD